MTCKPEYMRLTVLTKNSWREYLAGGPAFALKSFLIYPYKVPRPSHTLSGAPLRFMKGGWGYRQQRGRHNVVQIASSLRSSQPALYHAARFRMAEVAACGRTSFRNAVSERGFGTRGGRRSYRQRRISPRKNPGVGNLFSERVK